jgi:hypothetical protein
MIRVLLALFGICPHAHVYRERRELHGVQVMHFVCDSCGRAEPVVSREPEEHRFIVEAGAVKPPAVQRLERGHVLTMPRRRS